MRLVRRRSFLVAFAFLFVIGAFLFGRFEPAMAEGSCSVISPGVQRCYVGVPSDQMDAVQAHQETPVWCWAASAQMIFKAHQFSLDQSTIVSTVKGKVVAQTASDSELAKVMSSRYTAPEGDFQASFTRVGLIDGSLIRSLVKDEPLLVLTSHHAMVLSGLTYLKTTTGILIQVQQATVRDPYPGPSYGRRVLPPNEYAELRAAYRISTRRIGGKNPDEETMPDWPTGKETFEAYRRPIEQKVAANVALDLFDFLATAERDNPAHRVVISSLFPEVTKRRFGGEPCGWKRVHDAGLGTSGYELTCPLGRSDTGTPRTVGESLQDVIFHQLGKKWKMFPQRPDEDASAVYEVIYDVPDRVDRRLIEPATMTLRCSKSVDGKIVAQLKFEVQS